MFPVCVRMRTSRPADPTTGYPLLDRIAPISHYGFYILVLLMPRDFRGFGAYCDNAR
jgi:hypothetical protein